MGIIFGGFSPNVVPVQYAQPTTGQTVTVNAGVAMLFIDPAGTLVSLTVTLPSSPVNGQLITIATSQIITTLSITGTIVGTLTTLALGGYARFAYSTSSSKWFRCG